jgi:hypothetical protein
MTMIVTAAVQHTALIVFWLCRNEFSMWLAAMTFLAASQLISGIATVHIGKQVLSLRLSFEISRVFVRSLMFAMSVRNFVIIFMDFRAWSL